jgi:thiol-disulfide isomerase/thioredoxin
MYKKSIIDTRLNKIKYKSLAAATIGIFFVCVTIFGQVQVFAEDAPLDLNAITVAPSKADTTPSFAENFKLFRDYTDEEKYFPNIDYKDLDGRTYSYNNDLAGAYTLLNLWATWCGKCINEIPSLVNLEKKIKESDLKDEINFALIAFDFPSSSEDMQSKMEKIGLDADSFYPLYFYDLKVWEQLTVTSFPTTYLIGPDGALLYEMVGDAVWNDGLAYEFLTSVLSENMIEDTETK